MPIDKFITRPYDAESVSMALDDLERVVPGSITKAFVERTHDPELAEIGAIVWARSTIHVPESILVWTAHEAYIDRRRERFGI